MSQFVPLETSIFDPAFTLDPYSYIESLYTEPDVLGFSSEGMNFCFRFEDCHDLIGAHKNVAREPVVTEDSAQQAKDFAAQYPTRAWHFQYSLTDVKVKALLNRYLAALLDRVSSAEVDQTLAVLGRPGRHEAYMEDIALLPMRILLTAWGFIFTTEDLQQLYDTSIALVKSFDNFDDQALLQAGEDGMYHNRRYVIEQLNNAKPGTLLYDYAAEVARDNIQQDYAVAALVTFLQSTPNTLSISTVLMLRNIIRYPDAMRPLRENSALITDTVIMELLRRDNHVKALSRQVHTPFELRGKQLQTGDSLYIFYPGINLDPTHWRDPLQLDFSREFTRDNHNIFGGARYACIGSRIALKYFAELLPGVLACLPEQAQLLEDEIELDGDWIAERVITKMPILVA